MKQRLLNPQAARQFIVGLLFLFMALPLAQGQNKVNEWNGTSIYIVKVPGYEGVKVIIK